MLRKRMGLVIFFLVTLLMGLGILGMDIFSVKQVDVLGCDRPNEVRALADIRLGSSIFRADLAEIQERIESSPYYEVLSIHRVFPSGISVEVSERKPVAMIHWQNAFQVIGRDGTILDTTLTLPAYSCPVITGMEVVSWETGDKIGSQDPRQQSAMERILDAAQSQEVTAYISEVNISDPENITILSPHGMIMNIGNASAIERQMQWIDAVVPELYAMGYTRGLLTLTSPDLRSVDFLPESRMNKPAAQDGAGAADGDGVPPAEDAEQPGVDAGDPSDQEDPDANVDPDDIATLGTGEVSPA